MTHRARAELRLAAGSDTALALLDLKPDPLAPFVRVLSDLHDDERAEVILDLSPLSRAQRRRSLHKGTTASTEGDWRSELRQQFGGFSLSEDPLKSVQRRSAQRVASAQPTNPLARLELRAQDRHRHSKLSTPEAAFHTQVLIWAEAPAKVRARGIVAGLVAAFATFDDRNHWRVVGTSLPFLHVLGADSFLYRTGFDRRVRLGWFAPRKRSVVTASEIAGLITPPSVHCASASVARSGGLVPPAPPELPLWSPETPGVLPLGRVDGPHGERTVGQPIAEAKFGTSFGQSGYGKTEGAIVAFRAAIQEHGGLFLDPHADALARLRPYLTQYAERVVDLDLSLADTARQAGWNPLSMEGLGPQHIGRKVQTVVSAFGAATGMKDERNGRGLNLVAQAAKSLMELALHLPPGLHPTLFQIPTLLTDSEWRGEVLPYLSRRSREFWLQRLDTQTGGKEATSPVTNLFDRMLTSQHVTALFGQPRSTFDMRRAMDTRQIVLMSPLCDGPESLIHALFLFELHGAAKSRSNVPVDQRVPFYAWVDEVQAIDHGEGTVTLAKMLREDRKRGLRLFLMAQQPAKMSDDVLDAILTNRYYLSATAMSDRSAKLMASEWGKRVAPETIADLPMYHSIVQVTINQEKTVPFKVRGLSVEEAWGEPASDAEVAKMERTIDRTMARRPVAEVLAELDTLDTRILDWLDSRPVSPCGRCPILSSSAGDLG